MEDVNLMTRDELSKKVSEIMQGIEANAEEKILTTANMFFRIRCLIRKFSKTIDNTSIDWKWANEKLTTNVGQYDFNAFDRINSKDELIDLDTQLNVAAMFNGVWQKHICKDCREEFCLTYNEVGFYESKNLFLPKRCKSCRDKRKQGK